MLPFLLAIAGGYLIGNSMNETQQFDEGGMMADVIDEYYSGVFYKVGYNNEDKAFFVDNFEHDEDLFKEGKSLTSIKKGGFETEKEAREYVESLIDRFWDKYGTEEYADGGMMAKGGEIDEQIIKIEKALKNPKCLSPSVVKALKEKLDKLKQVNEKKDVGDSRDDDYAEGGMMSDGGVIDESIVRQGDDFNFNLTSISQNAKIEVYLIANREEIEQSELSLWEVSFSNGTSIEIYAEDENDAKNKVSNEIGDDMEDEQVVEVERISRPDKFVIELGLPTKNIFNYAKVGDFWQNREMTWKEFVGIYFYSEKKRKQPIRLELEEILDNVYVMKKDEDNRSMYVVIPKNEIKKIGLSNQSDYKKRKKQIKEGTFEFSRGYYDDDNRFHYGKFANGGVMGKGGIATMDDYIKNMTDYGGRGTKRKSTPKKSDSSKFSPDLIKKLRDMGYSEEEIKKIKVIS